MTNYLTFGRALMPAELLNAVTVETTSVYGADGQFDGVVVSGVKIAGEPSPQVIARWLADVDRANAPGGDAVSGEELALLRRKTASRAGNADDMKLSGLAYADDLARYPADIIRTACRRWADGSKWWPTWYDLKTECDRLAAERIAIRRALKAMQAEALKPKPEPRPMLEAPKPLPRGDERFTARIANLRNEGKMEEAALLERKFAVRQMRDIEPWAQAVIDQAMETRKKLAEQFAKDLNQ